MKPRVDAARLKRLLSEYGSLEEAVEAKRKAKSTLEKGVAQLQAKRARLEEDKSALEKQLETLGSQIAEKTRLLKQIEHMVEQRSWQYKLVTSLVAMLLTSPSREVTLHDLILLLERLERDGWHTIEKPQELRKIFIQVILGFYLRCYQCNNCGVRFILGGLPKDKPVFLSCKCPSCGSMFRLDTSGDPPRKTKGLWWAVRHWQGLNIEAKSLPSLMPTTVFTKRLWVSEP